MKTKELCIDLLKVEGSFLGSHNTLKDVGEGEAILVTVPTGTIILGVDYSIGDQRVWSAGKSKAFPDFEVASTDDRFYENSEWECIWLR